MPRSPLLLILAAAAIGVAACDRGANVDAGSAAAEASATSAGVIDSALPIATLLHRFRATIPDTPTVLTGGASSPEHLTRALLAALESHDTATVRALVLSRAEFAWLYYPHTIYTRPPYEMGPDLLWLQISGNSEKGVVRLLRRYGGSPLRLGALLCPDSAQQEGPNTIIAGCRVRFAAADSAARELRIFGSLLNRDGRYKFVSYANEL
jgi:hypothetical protein